jgi:hypothetical protein
MLKECTLTRMPTKRPAGPAFMKSMSMSMNTEMRLAQEWRPDVRKASSFDVTFSVTDVSRRVGKGGNPRLSFQGSAESAAVSLVARSLQSPDSRFLVIKVL